jgi:long-chain acyl-CoA synthetase
VIPHEANLRYSLPSHPLTSGIDNTLSLDELCHDQSVRDLVLKECNAIGKKNSFKTLELLQAVILTPDEWTAENGLVTTTQKLQRSKIAQKFSVEIDVSGLYFGSSLTS